MRGLGFSPSVHAWIMSSLKTTAQGVAFAFDLDGMFHVSIQQFILSLVTLYRVCRHRGDVCRLLSSRFVARSWCAAASYCSRSTQCTSIRQFLCPQNLLLQAPRWRSFALKTEVCHCTAHYRGWTKHSATSQWHLMNSPKLCRVNTACRSHLLGNCGHWLHVDNPDGAPAIRCQPAESPDSRV
jgi:hypothetical protein